MRLADERAALASACRRLAVEGLVLGTAGNVSARSGDLVALTPTGGVLADLEPEHMTVVDMGGAVVDGVLAPTSELGLHLRVYERFEWVGGVVHTHAPMATALSLVVDELPAVHYQMLALGGAVPVARYATFGSDELAERVVEALGGHTAALMKNHGAIAVGGDVSSAVELSLLLEWACTLYWRARTIGSPATLSQDQLAAVADAVTTRGYGTTRPIEQEPAP